MSVSVMIDRIQEGSPAEKAGIRAGWHLISINGHPIEDVLDYQFYATSNSLILCLEADGKRIEKKIEKEEYDDCGLLFSSYLMDEQHSCRNKCIFCFIDQLPKGMRSPLYFKDDDSRLSFFFGNYVTLTNMSQKDIDRIIAMHISPLNVSVHTTDPELRVRMMGNRFAGDVLRYLPLLAEAGIDLNIQLVLCRNYNDGEALERTLRDLEALMPAVQSIAVVPVGLTDHREGLTELIPFDKESALAVIEQIEKKGEEYMQKYGDAIVRASDEFYLLADKPFPPVEYYGEFSQLENGVGLCTLLEDEFTCALNTYRPKLFARKRSVLLATGVDAAPLMKKLVDAAMQKCHNLTCEVVPVRNDFFGHHITVAGLVTAGDILAQLKGKNLPDEILLPSVMLRSEKDRFLDDVTPEELRVSLGVDKITFVENNGEALLNALLGSAPRRRK